MGPLAAAPLLSRGRRPRTWAVVVVVDFSNRLDACLNNSPNNNNKRDVRPALAAEANKRAVAHRGVIIPRLARLQNDSTNRGRRPPTDKRQPRASAEAVGIFSRADAN